MYVHNTQLQLGLLLGQVDSCTVARHLCKCPTKPFTRKYCFTGCIPQFRPSYFHSCRLFISFHFISFICRQHSNIWNTLAPSKVDFSFLLKFKRSMNLLDFSQYLVCTKVGCQFHYCVFCTVHLLSLRAAISAHRSCCPAHYLSSLHVHVFLCDILVSEPIKWTNEWMNEWTNEHYKSNKSLRHSSVTLKEFEVVFLLPHAPHFFAMSAVQRCGSGLDARLSIRHMQVLCQNSWTYRQNFFTACISFIIPLEPRTRVLALMLWRQSVLHCIVRHKNCTLVIGTITLQNYRSAILW